MGLYMAPLEGITGWIYRNALYKYFGGFDKYFVPFIRPNQMGHFSSREKKDIMPDHNQGMYAVPQILTNHSDDFVRTSVKLKEYGYREVNLNLGCPSKTVVTKGRGAGFLADPDGLDKFLYDIFSSCPVQISVKTRLGIEEPKEFYKLIQIFNKYRMTELIIHPRVQKDYYKNKPNRKIFGEILSECKNKICYNGDIFCVEDYDQFKTEFPQIDDVMTGRGVLADPALGREIQGGLPVSKEELRNFHDMIYEGYCKEMSGDRTVLYKMKEFWAYLIPAFTESRKYAKKIRKVEKRAVYEKIIDELFINEDLTKSRFSFRSL